MRKSCKASFGLLELIEPPLQEVVVQGEGAKLRGFAPEFGNPKRKPIEIFLISVLEIFL